MLVSDESLAGQIRYWSDAPLSGVSGQEVLALFRELQRRRALDAAPVAGLDLEGLVGTVRVLRGILHDHELDDQSDWLDEFDDLLAALRAGARENCWMCGGDGIDPMSVPDHPLPCPMCHGTGGPVAVIVLEKE